MKRTLLVLAWLSGTLAHAQQPFLTFADGPAWSVFSCVQGTGTWCETQPFQFSDTPSLCGKTYASLPTGFWTEDTMYVRNEGPRTLFRIGSMCTAKEYLMYDFSLAVGDTVYAGLNLPTVTSADTAMFVLASIDTISVQGVERRRFNMLFDHCNDLVEFPLIPMEWIEGIGSTMHPFYPLACICDFCETGYSLLCCDSSGTAIFRSTPDVSCDGTIGLEEAAGTPPGFKVSGTDHSINLHFPSGFKRGILTVLDPIGRMVIRKQVSTDRSAYELPHLSPGTYTAVIQSGAQRWAARWVLAQ